MRGKCSDVIGWLRGPAHLVVQLLLCGLLGLRGRGVSGAVASDVVLKAVHGLQNRSSRERERERVIRTCQHSSKLT